MAELRYPRRHAGAVLAAAILLGLSAGAAMAQSPLSGKTITVVEPFGTGSLTETVMRLLKPGMEQALGARIVIETQRSPEGTTAFEHVARWNAEQERIEMWLRSTVAQRIRIGALDMDVDFAAGEEMLTEVSCKFRPDGVVEELAAAGLRRTHWWTDEAGDFGLSLSTLA